MKDNIRKLLRESIVNTKQYKLLTEKEKRGALNRLFLILEKEIEVGLSLTNKLKTIDSPLSKKLLNFFNSNKIKDTANVKYVDYNKDDEKLLTLGYEDKEGKIRKRLFKLNKLIKYLGGNLSDVKPYEIENLISFFKKADTSQLKLVDGDDILKAYHCKNYEDDETMGSCMRYEAAQQYLGIYVDNPDSVKCLVLLNPETKKVRGRALIWHMDDGEYFMDRIYTTNKDYERFFKKYAEEKNMSSYGRRPSDDVTLEKIGEYDYYPYMDTFKYYTPSNGELSHDSGELFLQDTGGEDSPPGNWSEYHQEYIPEDEAYYVESEEDYFYSSDIAITWDDQVVFAQSDNVIILDAGEDKGKYSLRDDAIEDYKGDWIKYDEAYQLDAGEYYYEFALIDETIEDLNGYIILDSEAIELTDGQYAGDYCLKSEAWSIAGDDIIHEDDVEDFKDKNPVKLTK